MSMGYLPARVVVYHSRGRSEFDTYSHHEVTERGDLSIICYEDPDCPEDGTYLAGLFPAGKWDMLRAKDTAED